MDDLNRQQKEKYFQHSKKIDGVVLVDLDCCEPEQSFKDYIEKTKRQFHKNLSEELENEKSKVRKLEESFANKSKSTESPKPFNLKNVDTFSESIPSFNSPELPYRSSYKTLSNDIDTSFFRKDKCINNVMKNRTLSQSIEKIDFCEGMSSTAARISEKLSLNRSTDLSKLIKPTENDTNRFSCVNESQFPIRKRRYRTVVKTDRFSSFLTRMPVDNSTLITTDVTERNDNRLHLNLTELNNRNGRSIENQSEKRIDFSKLINFTDKVVSSNDIVNQSCWICMQCGASNGDWKFNFCPSCAAPNPNKTNNVNKNDKSMSDISVRKINNDNKNQVKWICAQCANANDENRSICISCFCSEKSDKSIKETDSTINKLMNAPETINKCATLLKDDFPSAKWNCNVCLVDNAAENDRCVCCLSSNPLINNHIDSENSTFKSVSTTENCFDSNKSIPNAIPSIKFGSSDQQADSSKPIFKFGPQEAPKQNENQKSIIKFGSSNASVDGPKPVFNFGSVESRKIENQCSPIKFGSVNQSVDSEKPIFKFGSFGPTENDKTSTPVITFGSSTPINTTKIWFGSSVVKNNTDEVSEDKTGTCVSNGSLTTITGIDEGKWACPECWVDNSGTSQSCVCCQAKKPQINIKNQCNKDIINSINNNDCASNTKDWNCSTCLVDNKYSADRCVCCQEKNPNVKIDQSKHVTNLPIKSFACITQSMNTNQKASDIDVDYGSMNGFNDNWVFKFAPPEIIETNPKGYPDVPIDLNFEFSAPQKFCL